MRADASPATIKRCAIYTRKSSEQGLDQSFNSLDAQREACSAYVVSQRHEGWTLIPEFYDDGGYSGGTMERPGLIQLMADVKAGKIDIIVVYKVDRLTRSLSDFARMVDVLDAANASFVSITQAFNTTTSMGRLTLNVLLSFAQFEREVTGERIRDKIAQSKRKGMWMGGTVPLGYDVCDRKLIVNVDEAALIRRIFERYVALGSVDAVCVELADLGARTKVTQLVAGGIRGGVHFGWGSVRHVLGNRIYLGETVHKGIANPGEHEAIIAPELWEAVQARMPSQRNAHGSRANAKHASLLVGLVFDDVNRPMSPSHAVKAGKRYRYYVTHPKLAGRGTPPALRMPAHDLEQRVIETLTSFLGDASAIRAVAGNAVDASELSALLERAEDARIALSSPNASARQDALRIWVDRIALTESSAHLTVTIGNTQHLLETTIAKVRRGADVKLLFGDTGAVPRDEALVSLIADAALARSAMVGHAGRSLEDLARRSSIGLARFKRLLRLSTLAPNIVEAILTGEQPRSLTIAMLNKLTHLPLCWQAQQDLFAAL